jgi:thiol-disulfide isomerase/thioredoxin
MQVVKLGKSQLPMEVIMDYLESMKDIYTIEVWKQNLILKKLADFYQAYDLWTHNCNNFSNDFATFLLGKGIPEHITNLPDTVLNSPFGMMMRPMIDDMVRSGRQNKQGGLLGVANNAPKKVPNTTRQNATAVKTPTSVLELDNLLESAKQSCAVVFFTSQTCGPCKALYSIFDEMAHDAGYKGIFIKADIGTAPDIGSKYGVRATPTFMTFTRGENENKWVGADPAKLRGNIALLLQITWPPHRHESLKLPALRGATTRPVLYTKVPPLDKLMAKIGEPAKDPAVQGVRHFVETAAKQGASEVTLPDMKCFSDFLRDSVSRLAPESLFPIVDLLRVAMADARFSGYFAEEEDHKTIAPILAYVNDQAECPYSLRLVALQLACNLFSTPLYPHHILGCQTLTNPIVQLITTSLLDDKHHNVRVAAASLAFNIAVANNKLRIEERREGLPDGEQIELAASLLEAISVEDASPDALKGFLLAFGYLIFCVPSGGEMVDLLKTMDAQGTVLEKTKLFPKEPLVQEIGNELLGKGL